MEIRVDPSKLSRALAHLSDLGQARELELKGRGLVAAAVARLALVGHHRLAAELADHFDTPRPMALRGPESIETR